MKRGRKREKEKEREKVSTPWELQALPHSSFGSIDQRGGLKRGSDQQEWFLTHMHTHTHTHTDTHKHTHSHTPTACMHMLTTHSHEYTNTHSLLYNSCDDFTASTDGFTMWCFTVHCMKINYHLDPYVFVFGGLFFMGHTVI